MASIKGIYLSPSKNEAMQSQTSAEIEAGRGIVGDRYYQMIGTFSNHDGVMDRQQVTFVESEHIDEFNESQRLALEYGDIRRNIVTEGVRLNELEDKEFSFGALRFRGIELCQPCAHLAKTVEEKVLPYLVDKAGLRAECLTSGTLTVGDEFADC